MLVNIGLPDFAAGSAEEEGVNPIRTAKSIVADKRNRKTLFFIAILSPLQESGVRPGTPFHIRTLSLLSHNRQRR